MMLVPLSPPWQTKLRLVPTSGQNEVQLHITQPKLTSNFVTVLHVMLLTPLYEGILFNLLNNYNPNF